MTLFHRLGLGFALLLAAPTLALAAPKFPPLTGRVVDTAGILSPAAEQKLTGELAALEQKTGHQLVVATLPDLQGYEIADYGYQLGRAWGIGRSGPNDGAILIVAPKERAVRIEVGYGLEPVLTDAVTSLILQRTVLPAFRAGHLEQGVVDGAEAVAAQIGLPPDQARAAAAAAAEPVRIVHPDRSGGVPILLVIFVLFWVITGLMRAFGGRRRLGGGGGGGGGGGLWWLLPMLLSSSGRRDGGGGWSGGGSGGGFSGGGGSFGGGGASGRW